MIPWLPLGFAQPLVLLGLLSLPVLWWLLRLIPPQPRRIDFPPTRLLFDITPKEEQPRRTPWWLTLLRLTLAALVIIAAAGPLWNPPVATSTAKASLALLIDDGFPAAATWEARMRTAEDLIARAEADNRGVALVPLSETSRDISLEIPAAARVRLKQIKPKPHAVERADVLPTLGRFLTATPDVELVWLSDGVDLGGGSEFVAALARLVEQRSITVIEGGVPAARALSSADNAAGALTVKVLRAAGGTAESGTVRALDLKGLPLGDASFAFKPEERETEAELTLPVEIRNDIARHRDRRRALGRRRGAARQALAAAHGRRHHRRHRRHRAAAAGLDLLSRARARAVRRRAAGRPRLARPGGGPVHRATPADADPRRRRQCRGGARGAHALDRGGRRAGAVRGSAAGGCRRRSGAGEASARRPRARRQPVLGSAATARRLSAREPVLRHGGADRRHREPPGAGRARCDLERAHLGDAWRTAPRW